MREGSFHLLCFAVLVAALTISIGAPILAAEAAQSNVNLDLKDTDVKSAIEALFRGTGKNYSIDSNVQGTISALSIKDVPFDAALKSLTKSSGLVFRQDAGVYIISVRPDTSQLTSGGGAAAPATELASVDPTTAEPELKIEKIPLSNTSATEILAILGGNNNNNTRSYGGYGMGSGMGMQGGYGGYGGGMNSGYGGYGGGMNSGYGGYGGGTNSGYGGYGGYGSNRSNGSGYGGYGGYGGYSSGYGGGYGGGYSGSGGSGYRGW